MMIVVEPILMRPGVGGVKIEDLVLVTRNGTERVSSCPIPLCPSALLQLSARSP